MLTTGFSLVNFQCYTLLLKLVLMKDDHLNIGLSNSFFYFLQEWTTGNLSLLLKNVVSLELSDKHVALRFTIRSSCAAEESRRSKIAVSTTVDKIF